MSNDDLVRLIKCEQKLAIAIEALEFYADIDSWEASRSGVKDIINDCDITVTTDGRFICGGGIAREAIKQLNQLQD